MTDQRKMQSQDGGLAIGCEELHCQVSSLFDQSPHHPLRSLDVNTEQGIVTLKGRVRSFYYKQLAQETVKRVAGVKQIINDVVVCPTDDLMASAVAYA